MTRTPLLLAIVAATALAGCNSSDHTIIAGSPDDLGDNSAANTPVALPASIASSKTYRCKNNKLIYVDWMSDSTARVKQTHAEVGTAVTPGAELKGDPKGSTITYNGQSCKA